MESFPPIIVITHFINLFCLVLLIRSGIQILYDHPKLYWTDHTTADNHWLKFGKKIMPKDRLWTALDEPEDPGPLALPGGIHNLGAGRHWHFATAIVWGITGFIYVSFLLISGHWIRIIPTDIGIFSRAIDAMISYMTLQIPPPSSIYTPYNALQQLTYTGVIFILSPMMIITGLAMSPALVARFPGFLKLFGNRRQVARSLHFLGMVGYSVFAMIHLVMTLGLHFVDSVKKFTFGNTEVDFVVALKFFITALILLVLFNAWASVFTLKDQVKLRFILTGFYTPIVRLLFGWMGSRQYYTKKDISSFFRVNGYPPKTSEYEELTENNFKDWKLKVYGLVENPLELSLEEIKNLDKTSQITKHNCIQGWTAVAEWSGVEMAKIMELCKPSKNVKYVIFHCLDRDANGAYYYSGLRLSDMYDKQTILAYEMNGEELPIKYGAPLRLRCEMKYGYKMAKYLKSIEFVEDFKKIGQGRGGYREDTVFFDWEASI